jgi:hypothetical protein
MFSFGKKPEYKSKPVAEKNTERINNDLRNEFQDIILPVYHKITPIRISINLSSITQFVDKINTFSRLSPMRHIQSAFLRLSGRFDIIRREVAAEAGGHADSMPESQRHRPAPLFSMDSIVNAKTLLPVLIQG